MEQVALRLFASVFIIGGAGILIVGGTTLLKASNSKTWPTVSGRIVSSAVKERPRNKGRTTYDAVVRYEYEVSGYKYTSNDVAFGDYGSGKGSHASKIVDKHRVGSEVTVHYSPSNPGKAVLEAGESGNAFEVLGFGSWFFVGGLYLFVFGPAKLKQQSDAQTL